MIDRFRDSASFLSRLAKDVPDDFLDSIYKRTNLHAGKRLLELGCGSGELAAWYALKGVTVDGVDLSGAMIATARAQFAPLALSFHQVDAVDFMLAATQPWDVVMSFESMHLCVAEPMLPAALRKALAGGGFLVVAWRSLEWEETCRQTIIKLLGRFKVPFDDWGFWTCPSLPDVLTRTGFGWRSDLPLTVRIEHSSTVQDVVHFMLCVDRVQDLPPNEQAALESELRETLERLAQGGIFAGTATYSATIVELFCESEATRTS